MKRTEEGQPFLSWCLIARNCEKTIEATLKSIRERTPQAEIVIVDTMSSDGTVEIAKRYADVFEVYRGPNGDWTKEMAAFDDAAAARNESFRLATGKFVAWIDTDDVLPGPEEVEKLLRENGRYRPGKETELKLEVVRGKLPDGEPIGLEELIERITRADPTVVAFYAPYLYRRNADGTAAEWQERERIVRNDGSWHWVGKGHEVLVPKDGGKGGKLAILSSLLFVHMKEWNHSDYLFSATRHYNALVKEYEAGDRSSRTALYLENLCKVVAPWRREEFLQVAYNGASTKTDRCRALIRAGELAAENGFAMDALESFTAATAIRPDLPDPWLAGGMAFEHAEDFSRAAEWFERGVSLPVNAIESLVNPRDMLIGYRAKAAECYRRVMREAIQRRDGARAREAAQHRLGLLQLARDSEAAGPDKQMLGHLVNWAENDLQALQAVEHLHALWDYLVRNEETKKAAKLIELAPHTLEDHPVVFDLENWAKKVNTHLADPEAYAAFYNSLEENGAEFDHTLFDREPLPRARFLIDWVKKYKPNARILEVGCFDGSIGIHVLRECPDVSYVAVDAMLEAIDHFQARADKEGFADRLSLHLGMDLDEVSFAGEGQGLPAPLRFDVIVFFEIIEHVPDPVKSLKNLRSKLRPGGKLFVSTPWGAYDRGHPYNLGKRDPRGHVRAMTAVDLADALGLAGYRVETLNGANGCTGATLHAIAAPGARGIVLDTPEPLPVHFFVPSALWNWNSTKLIETGMGASEETICYLAREIARDPREMVNVYGPVPEDLPCVSEEVHDGVGYWTRNKIAKASPGTLIVSRSPSTARMIDPEGKHDRILWLQDTIYPDLNADTAADYRKIVVLTEWHKKLTAEQIGTEEAHRLEIIPNFLLAEHFKLEGAPEREPHHFIYASSPDRGLVRLLKLWPRILERWSDATLDIFYGWEGCMKLGSTATPGWIEHYRKVRTEYMTLRWQKGVTERGRVNHEVLAREFQRASAWTYPTSFAETGCLTAAKARAAGCVPVTTPYAGLAETAACDQTRFVPMPGVGELEDPTGTPEAFEAYAKVYLTALGEAIDTPNTDRTQMSLEAIAKYEISAILPLWKRVIGG